MNDPAPLLVDRAAAAARPTDAELAEWAATQRVFISSVMDGYGEFRSAARDAIRALGAIPVAFEDFGGREADPENAYLSEVASSSVYVGLLGARYGRPLPTRFSATHAEFRHAETNGLRLSVWTQADVEREGPQQSFLEEVRAFHTTGAYHDAESLKAGLLERLREIGAQELAPWCKLGQLVFRAREIVEAGSTVSVRATVHDPDVAAALQDLAGAWGRHRLTFAYPDRCVDASVEGLRRTTRASRGRDFELQLGVSEVSEPMRVTYNGIEWDDMTELALKVSLFGESNPLGLMASQAEITNPLPALFALSLSEDALGPVARLLLTEVLVRERGVSRLTEFALGSPVGGRRPLKLQFLSPSPYAGHPPVRRSAEGLVAA